MPKIPLPQRQFIEHQDNAVPLSGAPDLNWHTDKSAEGIADAMRGLGSFALSIGDVAVAKQEADDADNFAELQLVTDTRYGELDSKLKENPQDYEKFGEYRQEAVQNLAEETKPLLEKMSPRMRREADRYLRGRESRADKFTRDIAYQADITMKRGSYDMRIRQYAKTGDITQAKKQLDLAIGTGILNPNEREMYENFIGELSDFGAVEREIDSGKVDVAERLKTHDEDGVPANFKGLSAASRKQLIRYAEQTVAKRELESTQSFIAALNNGTSQATKEELDAELAYGLISPAVYNSRAACLKEYENGRMAARKAVDEKKKESLAYQIKAFEFDTDPGKNVVQKRQFIAAVEKEFKGDYKTIGEFQTLVDQRSEMVGLKRKVFGTVEGQICKKWLETNATGAKFYRDPNGLFNKQNDAEFVRRRALEASDLMAEQLKKGATAEQAIAAVEKQLAVLNDGRIRELYADGKMTREKKLIFDSRSDDFFPVNQNDWTGYSHMQRDNQIKKMKESGAIDRADIVRTVKLKHPKTGAIVPAYQMKDGRYLPVDEYGE